MISAPTAASRHTDDEIGELIATLHKTSRRLEQLTGGQVDTVADAEGRPFLLRHVQEQLGQARAARQAAILNALPAHVALLDSAGTIVSVNEAWRQFAYANELKTPGFAVGVNYLDVCDRAVAVGSCGAGEVAKGLRAVLYGQEERFSIEYPCHSPTEERWFLLTATPLSENLRNGAIVMHVNVTAEQKSTQLLRASESEFRSLAESMPQIVWITRPDGWNIYFSQQWVDYTGLTLEASLGHGWNKPFHPDDQQAAWAAWTHATATAGIYSIESRLRRADGVYRWWLVRGVPLMDGDGRVLKWFGTCTDIHDLKMAGLEVARTNLELRESERRQRRVAEQLETERAKLITAQRVAKVGSWETDIVTGELEWSEETHRIHGTDPAIYHPTHPGFLAMVHPEDQARVDDAFVRSLDQHSPWVIEHRLVRPSGETRVVEERWQAILDAEGKAIRAVGTCQDITERRAAEARIVYLSRVHAMLSGINTLIVRVRDRDELFKGACNIAVEAGGFRMCLIAMVGADATTIAPVASEGKDERLLAAVRDLLSRDEVASTTMVARAIRTREAVVSNDSQQDPRVLLKDQYAESGVRSLTILPLLRSHEAVGVLVLYASEIDFFHEEELKLLRALAGDIVFCLSMLDIRAEREKADRDLRSSLKEKQALLKEVHHRVKNNMQVITSLLRLESNRIDHCQTRMVLKDMQNRIMAMAALHEGLYRSNDFARVDLAAYLKQLAGQLSRSLVATPGQVALQLELVPVEIELDQAVPCGLIVNELISNALKHAFPDGRTGKVRMETSWVEAGLLRLRITDDGIGLPQRFDAIRAKSLGLQIVSDLARQLGGRLDIGPGPVAMFELTFRPQNTVAKLGAERED
ncbi:MAG: PAS domain-containing protein [Vicinamibacteria bacterium]